MNCGLKYLRDGFDVASALSLVCQKSRIFFLTRFLKGAFDGGFDSRKRGEGRPYCVQRCLIWTNQEEELSGSVESLFCATLNRIFSGSRIN